MLGILKDENENTPENRIKQRMEYEPQEEAEKCNVSSKKEK